MNWTQKKWWHHHFWSKNARPIWCPIPPNHPEKTSHLTAPRRRSLVILRHRGVVLVQHIRCRRNLVDVLLHHHHRPGLEPMETLGVVLQKGGLGIETLRVFWHQVAFLVRWVFKFLAYTEPNCWWKIFLPREITAMTFGRENVQGKIHGFILHIAKNHWSPQLSFHEQK